MTDSVSLGTEDAEVAAQSCLEQRLVPVLREHDRQGLLKMATAFMDHPRPSIVRSDGCDLFRSQHAERKALLAVAASLGEDMSHNITTCRTCKLHKASPTRP